MIQRLSGTAWFKPAAIGACVLAVVALWQSIAAVVFLARYQQDYTEASPFTLFRYWFYYRGEAHISRWIGFSSALAALVMVALGAMLYSPKKRALFGEARFATRRDMKKAGLLGEDGIMVGRLGADYLKFDGPEHVLLAAPTREKKGVAIVIPTALTWKQSLVVLDTKGEVADITSGYRALHQPVYFLNFVSETYNSDRYNPLAYISTDPNLRINDVQKIGHMMIPDRPQTDPIWTATPRNLFLGIVLYLLETPGKLVTFGQVLRETLVEGDGAKYFARIVKDRAEAGKPLSSECVMALNSYISISADVTRAGIMAGFRSRFELWASPLVDAATSNNDFDLRDLRKKPMTIYVGVTQDNLERMAPLINLFFQQLIDLNTRELPQKNKALKYTCLLEMDELPSVGKIPALAKGIAYLAGYGLRVLSVVQNPAQLVELLGREAAKNYVSNHGLQIAFAPKATEIETADEISKWLGYMTVKGGSKSKSKNGSSESESDQKRALMLPQEVVDLGTEWSIIVKRGMPPARVLKIQYYSDPNFKARLLPAYRVPRVDMAAHNALIAASTARLLGGPVFAAAGETIRDLTATDIPNLHKLAISQFVLDFSTVVAPVTDTLDIAALNAYADMRCREAGITVEANDG